MEGTLSKWTNVMKGWQYRYFVLDDNAGLFSYYTSREKMMRGARRGCVRLRGALIGIDDEDDATFTITVDGKTFHFQARDSEEREKWIRALEETVLRHNQMRRSTGQPRAGRTKWAGGNEGPPTIHDFDKKLAETDSYLQLLLNQVSGLKAKMEVNSTEINSSSETGSLDNNSDACGLDENAEDHLKKVQARKSKYEDIASKAIGMTESIKHAIVLLQIAKNASTPQPDQVKHFKSGQSSDYLSQGGITDVRNQQQVDSPVRRPHPDKELDKINFLPAQVIKPSVATGIPYEKAKEGIESDNRSGDIIPAPIGANRTAVQPQQNSPLISPRQSQRKSSLKIVQQIPESSYESDSDDEQFYECENFETEFDGGKCPVNATQVNSAAIVRSDFSLGLNIAYPDVQVEKHYANELLSPMTPGFDQNDENIDYDKLYEDRDADEGDLDMKSHGSVITHLLSQVRIGMDLTRIVLPTFILERRSLLEMYSDFFAHPDLYLDIADGNTPEERMIRVLKWYLSSFHAGRKSSIAKKPYNPIIGETFRCHWNLPSDKCLSQTNAANLESHRSVEDVAKESALPECGPDELTFIAEQVSHHPPISAFYAEHVKKRISTSAHIYTKSSFLGMSVAVHNVGKGTVTLFDHEEEYVATFPSAFARSILSVPWVELGGKCEIHCSKTGYSATLEFKCKPFFSSDVNKVTAEVFAPNEKKPILKVDGEWNGKMIAKWSSGKNEVFIDVAKLPLHPKLCKPVAQQSRLESRRLWKNVTYNLKENNIDAATNAKFALEQKQRMDAAERKENGVKWKTEYFTPRGHGGGNDRWFYNTPLNDRLLKK